MDEHRRQEDRLYDGLEVRVARIETAQAKDFAYIISLLTTQSEAKDKALAIQAQEYTRRLEALNGEAERLRKMQETYLPREKFEDFEKNVNHAIKELRSFKDNLQGRMTATSIGVSLVISLIVVTIKVLIFK